MMSIAPFAQIRPAAVAGQFYTADAKALAKEVDGYLSDHPDVKVDDHTVAVIVPHAGYVFSGDVAGAAYAALSPDHRFDHIFLLGPSHHVWLGGASVAAGYKAYQTPLGQVPVDTAFCQQLIDGHPDVFRFAESAHDREHDLEVQLPFLQRRLKTLSPIVPIIISTDDIRVLQKIAEILRPYLNEKNIFIISSDFSHYPRYQDAEKVDNQTAQALITGDCATFINQLRENAEEQIPNLATSACGEAAIATLLLMTEKDKAFHIHHLLYRNSGDSEYGGHDQVVGYHAFTISKDENTTTNATPAAAQYKPLLKIARTAIETRLNGHHYHPDSTDPALTACQGAFVTLHTADGRLRGCIGHFGEDIPLQEVVAEMAEAAAFEDPRFYPVTKDELPHLQIEISVLTPMKRIHDISEFKLHRDGIYMVKNGRSGTFLPQVADEVNWDKEEFLGHCAQDKAGIGWDGWRDADLYTYQAIIIHE